MATPSGDQRTVIFDGSSALHSGIRRWVARRDRHERISWVPCQATAPAGRGGRLCERTIVLITPEGEVDTGSRALGRVLSDVGGSPWPRRIATAPVLCPLLTMAFSGVAALSRRMPGVATWCAEHPEDCRPRP